MDLSPMFNNLQNWNAFPVSYDSYMKSMEPATKALQAIASEANDYTKKTTETARSYFQKFSGVKNFEEAVKLQNEFASSAYQEFMKESAKFGDLYRDYFTAVFPQTVDKTTEKKPSKTVTISEGL